MFSKQNCYYTEQRKYYSFHTTFVLKINFENKSSSETLNKQRISLTIADQLIFSLNEVNIMFKNHPFHRLFYHNTQKTHFLKK